MKTITCLVCNGEANESIPFKNGHLCDDCRSRGAADRDHTAENPDGKCIFNNDLICVICGSGFPGYYDKSTEEAL